MENKLSQSPIDNWIDLTTSEDEFGPVFHLKPSDRHIGNPNIKAIHGGVVATFLELAATKILNRPGKQDGTLILINTNVDYLRSARFQTLNASASIVRMGRRSAVVEALAWQDNIAKPVAKATCTFHVSI
jgi:uncharacterized protein (TIGR00369 family)